MPSRRFSLFPLAVWLILLSWTGQTPAHAQRVLNFQLQDNNLVLAWPTNPGGLLQSTTNLASTNWIIVSNTTIVGGQLTVTNAMTNRSQFYRLVPPPCHDTNLPVDLALVWSTQLISPDLAYLYPPDLQYVTNINIAATLTNVTPHTVFDGAVSDTDSFGTNGGYTSITVDMGYYASYFEVQVIGDGTNCVSDYAYAWTIQAIGGSADFTDRAITGYLTPKLTITQDSLPTETDHLFHLNVTRLSDGRVDYYTARVHTTDSQLLLEDANVCQTKTNACDTCPCRFEYALPTLEPHN